MLLNLSFIHQQEVAIHLFHNFIPHNACKMLEVRVIKEFNLYEPREKLPPSVKGKGGGAAAPVAPAPQTVTTIYMS